MERVTSSKSCPFYFVVLVKFCSPDGFLSPALQPFVVGVQVYTGVGTLVTTTATAFQELVVCIKEILRSAEDRGELKKKI